MNELNAFQDDDQLQAFCPACGGDLRMAVVLRGEARQPRAGDQTVCEHCLTYLRFVDAGDEGQLRLDVIQREEFDALPEVLQAGLMQARGQLQAIKESRAPSQWEKAIAVELTAVKQRLDGLEEKLGQEYAEEMAALRERVNHLEIKVQRLEDF